jgi:hypothetical protein
MRFTTRNTFIVSTFALLSLITPVANAVDLNYVGRITLPTQRIPAGNSTFVNWYVVKQENPSTVCYRWFLTAGIAAGPSTPTRHRI